MAKASFIGHAVKKNPDAR